MRFFIDFEATEHKEIMSIGCISECGDTFYSLVRPQEEYKDWYIKKITGIRNKELSVAPDVNEVFKEFYSWITSIDNCFDIYCYGTDDINFILKSLTTADSLSAIAGLLLIKNNLIDFSSTFVKKTPLEDCSLQDAHSACINDYQQEHNALNDAIMLKNIFYYSFNKFCLDVTIVRTRRKFKKEKKRAKSIKVHVLSLYDSKHKLVKTFNSYKEAMRWLQVGNPRNKGSVQGFSKTVKKHIAKGTMYHGYYFKSEMKKVPNKKGGAVC